MPRTDEVTSNIIIDDSDLVDALEQRFRGAKVSCNNEIDDSNDEKITALYFDGSFEDSFNIEHVESFFKRYFDIAEHTFEKYHMDRKSKIPHVRVTIHTADRAKLVPGLKLLSDAYKIDSSKPSIRC